jgi:predicted nucleic acid-binding protein
MNGFLLDTNIVSELVRPRPEPRVVGWIDSTDDSLLHLSVLTLSEIRKSITSLEDPSRRVSFETWLDHDLALRFAGRILPVDLPVANRWGRISGSAAARKSPIPVIDGLLAATALQHGLTLVSRDIRHASRIGVPAFNPWTD